MKKTFQRIMALTLCLMMCLSALPMEARAAGAVAINTTNFPDAVFRAYVKENFDADKDGSLSKTEIADVTEIYVEEMGIASMKGVEVFSSLVYLDCGNNRLTALDVTKNVMLETLECSKNYNLSTLDVTHNKNLKKLSAVWCPLGTLDVSENKELIELYCLGTNLKILDISNNTKLKYLTCHVNSLTKLDVSGNTALEYLICYSNQLTTLDIRNNPKLIKAVTDGTKTDGGGIIFHQYEIGAGSRFELSHDDGVALIYKDAKPAILTQPEDQTAVLWQSVDFIVDAAGYDLMYQWYVQKKGTTT